jgi:hypothetical protein
VTTRLLAGAAIAAAAMVCVLAGCSPGADYPSLFPAIHDMPPPRADAPLDPVQVQQATDDLVTQRNQLNAEMQKNPQKPSANTTNPPPARNQAAAPGNAQNAAAAGAQTAGTETK